ncbi:MAG: hypothetical protein KF805_12320 [Phycisphaeraceae bacterium]|nr:hypothetical protein [Phycisphaeraceae bacterium]
MFTIKIDKSRWEARYRRILSRRVYARRAAVIEAAKLVVRRAYATAPTDTGRFKKNLAEAANAAGVGPLPVIATKRSRYAEIYLSRLTESVAYWKFMDDRYQRENRTREPFYRKILRKRARAERELARFEQTNDAIVIGGLRGSKDPSVRYKLYRGSGRIVQTRNTTVVQVHNTEAHASFVERRSKVMRNAISAVKAGGAGIARLTKKKYLEVLGEKRGGT